MSLKYLRQHGEGDLYSVSNPARIDVPFVNVGPSKTRQEFSAECDVNMIMDRYNKTGEFPFKEASTPIYYDFVGMPDLQDALVHLHNADAAFASLPAAVRKEFDNDPVRFVEYATNADNVDQLRKWGLAEPAKAPDAPMRVEVVNAPSIVAAAPAAAPDAPIDYRPTRPA